MDFQLGSFWFWLCNGSKPGHRTFWHIVTVAGFPPTSLLIPP